MLNIVAKRLDKINRKKQQEDLIEKMKEMVKKEEAYVEICNKYNVDLDYVDHANISFDDKLDVSAKTINGDVFLNGKLFDKGDMCDNVRYVIHEFCHILQQEHNLVEGKTPKEDYLDDPNEQEAFQYQLQFMDDHMSEEEIQEYLEQLMDHHDVKGKERREKIKILKEKIE